MKRFALAALMLAASFTAAACAAYDDLNVAISYFDMDQYDNAIVWFDKAIAAGDLIPDLMCVAYLDRGLAHESKGDSGSALADFTAAIAAQPNDLYAYRSRAAIYVANGQLEKALADYEQLDRLRPGDRITIVSIGLLNWQLNRIEASAAAFAPIADTDSYAWLWLQLANVRLNKPMTHYAETFDDRNWPGHVPRYFLGHLSEAELMEAAENAKASNSVCIASVFAGLWHLVHNEQSRAVPLLESASQKCVQNGEMWRVVRGELGKLTVEEKSK